jgi:hypothetical protein
MKRTRTDFITAIKGIVALAAALAPLAWAADIVYKYRRPDGSVVYTDAPLPGARLIGRYQLLPREPAGASEGAAPRGAADPDEQARQRSFSLQEVDERIKAGELALKEAQDRQQAGVEPLEGERIANVQRGSRFRPEYFARQKQLADEVQRAQIELDEAYRQRSELRD